MASFDIKYDCDSNLMIIEVYPLQIIFSSALDVSEL